MTILQINHLLMLVRYEHVLAKEESTKKMSKQFVVKVYTPKGLVLEKF